MNYLGHIFLSGKNEQILVGNFIADKVKGKKYKFYPVEIQKGILLHRLIDEFTDKNKNFQSIKSYFVPSYNHYSGVVSDLIVDHFLAAEWENYSDISLDTYTKQTYHILLRHYHLIPPRIRLFLHNLIYRDRLLTYKNIEGIEEALSIMSYRTTLPELASTAIRLLNNNYSDLRMLSSEFIQEILSYNSSINSGSIFENDLEYITSATAQICFDQGLTRRIVKL